MDRILEAAPGSKVLLLGNEAIARAALEAGVAVATTYPGTPASEIGDTLARVAKDAGIYFEYSANEMVATEVAIGAAASGVRALVSMKHVGVNVAADALLTFAYTGTRGGFVLVTADDPSCHSSQNEQDNRYYALLAGIPLLEPSSPQECLEMTRQAFDISEKLELPVLLRTTTRISHVRGPVVVGEVKPGLKKKEFVKDPTRFVTVPAVARSRHLVLLQKLVEAEGLANISPLNKVVKIGIGGKLGIVASSAAFNYSVDAATYLKLDIDILKLGFSHPLPSRLIVEFLKDHDAVAVVEELEPVLETAIRAVAQREGLETRVLGKADGILSRAHELDQAIVSAALVNAFGLRLPELTPAPQIPPVPVRPPVLCAGCPHSATYYAVSKATNKKAVFASDIGCYTLGLGKPYEAADLLVCMGSSVGTAGGLAKVNDQPVIAFIGDSTFFHAGIPGLINAVHNGHKFLLMILDNRTTAMTGHQPHPGSEKGPTCCDITSVSIEEVVTGCGVKWLKVVDPYDVKTTIDSVKEGMAQPGISVIISRRECALIAKRDEKGAILGKRFIDQDACKKCRTCVDRFQCPAISSLDKVQSIDDVLCAGCGVCEQVCPYKAIKEAK
ncbi:MAG: indolepyruvate ferredoxin oxidoreductase subunit alpha [Thermoplasmata archaeon]|jgi:indolepyruvate ferredoxin oxidoreductase alpha subunit|nr:indolepyruvate ferredoxin oxidoreductase subunit alpha [Thermoplasmata archaeon]